MSPTAEIKILIREKKGVREWGERERYWDMRANMREPVNAGLFEEESETGWVSARACIWSVVCREHVCREQPGWC